MIDENMLKLAEIRNSYSLKNYGYLNFHECALLKYDELCLDIIKENKELKTKLHESSLQIQCLIEQDIDCPSNCNKLRRLKEQQKEFIEWLQANLEALIMCDREFILTNNKKEIKAYSEILSKYKEIIGVKDE